MLTLYKDYALYIEQIVITQSLTACHTVAVTGGSLLFTILNSICVPGGRISGQKPLALLPRTEKVCAAIWEEFD
jgi:hypothetical protein